MPATSLTLRLQKGSPLTYTELDNNFLFITSSISSSINTAISGSVNRVAVFSSANKITGSSILNDNGTSLTITGPLTVSGNDAVINALTVGKGGSNNEYNTAVGAGALSNNGTGYNNTAIGYTALANNDTGYNNTAIGYTALNANDVGYRNTALGYGALSGNEGGYSNIAIGSNALGANTVGYSNIAIGLDAGRYTNIDNEDNTNSNTSIYIGSFTRPSTFGTNEIVIGYAATGSGNNSVTIGNTSTTKTILRNNVGIGTSSPSYSLDVNGTTRVTGTTLVSGSLIASGSTHTLTSTTANINSTTTTLTSTALNLNSNHITASGQTSGDIDFTIAPGGAGSATVNLQANTGGTSILNATGNNNTLSIKTNSIERININGNGTTAITGSLSVTGSNTLIGTKIITGSVFISGSKTIIGTNTITGSLNVSGSVTIKGGVSASSFTGSLFGTASYALTASYVAGGSTFDYEYLSLTGTNSSTANVLTKSYTDVDSAGGNYCKLPLSPTIGTTIYVSNIDSTMNLFVVGNTSQFISF